jgi:serine/threonine-protein kinase
MASLSMKPELVVYLIDPEQGHPLQFWSFEGEHLIRIGRSTDNEIVISHPYVSRAHALLEFDGGAWNASSISQQGIYWNASKLMQLRLLPGVSFRLGPQGPQLQIGETGEETSTIETTRVAHSDEFPILALDREKLRREVSAITEGDYFQRLQATVRRLRDSEADETLRGS